MIVTFHPPGTFNGSDNKYQAPAGNADLIAADLTQNAGSDYLYNAGVPVPKSEAEFVSDGVMNENSQLYGCISTQGIFQYSDPNTPEQVIKIRDWQDCYNVEYVLDTNGDQTYDTNGDPVVVITKL